MFISKRKIGVVGIALVISILEYIIFATLEVKSISLSGIFTIFAVMVMVTIAIQIVLLKMAGIDFISPIMFFLLFCYVFHFGQILVTNIYEFDYTNYVTLYMARNMDTLRETIMVCFNGMNFTFFGVLLYSMLHKNISLESDEVDEIEERRKCLVVGKVLFLISTPFRFYQDIRQLLAATTLGYHGAINLTSVSGVFGAIAGFWYSSIIFLYIGRRNRYYLWLGVTYAAFTMLTGNRGHQLTNIIVMVLVYFHVEKIRPTIKQIIKFGLLVYFGLLFVDMIMNFRRVGISHFFSNIGYYLTESLKANILFETIGSFGETIFTPFIVIEQMGKEISPFIGEAWLCSILTIIPNIGGITTYTNLHSNYPKMLIQSHAIGGSYIGDLYYNFRGAYWIVALVVGMILCSFSMKYKDAVANRRYSKLIIYVPFFYNSFWWVRDSLGNLTRPLVWQILLSLIILNIFSSRRVGSR